MHFNLFAYGTLQDADVMAAVTGRRFASQTAWLYDYARYALVGKVYPGLCYQPGARTEGILYTGLASEDIERLDAFEDDFYRRVNLKVTVLGGQKQAEVYVIPNEHRTLLDNRSWELARFQRTAKTRFMKYCHASASSFPDSKADR